MNNNNEDQGQRNAATLIRILEKRRAGAAAEARRARPRADRSGGLPADELIDESQWLTEAP